MLRHLIWDFGGTLFDTYPATVAAMRAALDLFGAPSDPARVMALCRQSRAHCVNTFAAERGLDPAALMARFKALYRDAPPESQPPFAGAADLCARALRAGGGNYIITHRGRASMERLLAHHGMTHLFADCITGDDSFPRKPDPAALRALMARNRLPRAETLAIGDRALDILAAQAAGVQACWFGDAAPSGVTPDYAVASYAALAARLFPEARGSER